MNKEKGSAGVSQANVPGVPQNTSGVPVKRLRSSRRWIVIICIIVVVAAAAGVVVVTVTSPENIMRSYLRSKYGKDFVLAGEMMRRRECNSRECGSVLQEHYYESEARPVDNPRIRFEVVLDGDNVERKYKKSDDYIKTSRTQVEEDRLRPYIERIFGKDTEFGVEFRLCKIDGDSPRSFVDLSRAMRICKEKTAGMTEDQIFASYIRMYHSYELYIYDPDGQSIKTNGDNTGDKARIVERLKKMVKYLPDGRPDSMWLCYFIKRDEDSIWSHELKVSVDDLRQMTDSFSNDLFKPIVTNNDGGSDPYPIRKGWDK